MMDRREQTEIKESEMGTQSVFVTINFLPQHKSLAEQMKQALHQMDGFGDSLDIMANELNDQAVEKDTGIMESYAKVSIPQGLLSEAQKEEPRSVLSTHARSGIEIHSPALHFERKFSGNHLASDIFETIDLTRKSEE